jgi:HEAT repeat protein
MGGGYKLAAAVLVAALLLGGCVQSGLQGLQSGDPARRAQAVDTLVNAGSQAIPQLRKLVERRDYGKYAGIAQALARIGGDAAIEMLKTMA